VFDGYWAWSVVDKNILFLIKFFNGKLVLNHQCRTSPKCRQRSPLSLSFASHGGNGDDGGNGDGVGMNGLEVVDATLLLIPLI
jgi:hypothetical protein